MAVKLIGVTIIGEPVFAWDGTKVQTRRKLGLMALPPNYVVQTGGPLVCQGSQCPPRSVGARTSPGMPGGVPVGTGSQVLPTPTATVTTSPVTAASTMTASGDDPQCLAAGEVGGPYPNCTYAI